MNRRRPLLLTITALFSGVSLAAAFATAEPRPHPASGATSKWWSNAVIYEVYPRSFQDSDGDGVGDLQGVVSRLPYLESLGVDAIWLTPIQPSPNRDFGYDITDYTSVAPSLGRLATLDRLVAEGRRHRIRVILDLVLNHTSALHPWFRASAASRTNPYADWYVWSDGVVARGALSSAQRANVHDGRAPPNNWTSSLGESSWTWAPSRRQFYYHRFDASQPDLNWRNPAVEAAMVKVMRFWLDRGVAGFRLDAVTSLLEDRALNDEPRSGDRVRTDSLPETQAVIRRLRAVTDSYPGERVLIGETYAPNVAALSAWYGGPAHDGLQLPMDLQLGFAGDLRDGAHLQRHLRQTQTRLGALTPLYVLDNHDQVRSIDRAGDGRHDVAIAKALATVLYLSRGAALTYYGAELGMRTREPRHISEVRDPRGLPNWPREKGRDGERTPMQWTAGWKAGFSSAQATWLPVSETASTINVEAQTRDPRSLLSWTRSLIALRRTDPAAANGAMSFPLRTTPGLVTWTRADAASGHRLLVYINMSERRLRLTPPAGAHRVLGTGMTSGSAQEVVLAPYDVWVGRAPDSLALRLERGALRLLGRG